MPSKHKTSGFEQIEFPGTLEPLPYLWDALEASGIHNIAQPHNGRCVTQPIRSIP